MRSRELMRGSTVRLRRSFTRSYHQIKSDTSPDRYPALFSFAAASMDEADVASNTILSYGCSVGDECFTLRSYLPSYEVLGTDISRRNLRTATRRNQDEAIDFV